MTDPVWHKLNAIRDILIRLERDHPQVRAAMAAGGYPSSSNGLADPQGNVAFTTVESATLRRIATRVGDYQKLIEQAAAALLEAQRITAPLVTADITRVRLDSRCDGWERPECEENGVQNVWVNGANLFLCAKCWGRQRVQKSRQTA